MSKILLRVKSLLPLLLLSIFILAGANIAFAADLADLTGLEAFIDGQMAAQMEEFKFVGATFPLSRTMSYC